MKKGFSMAQMLFFVSVCTGLGGFFIANYCTEKMSTTAWISVVSGILICFLFVRMIIKNGGFERVCEFRVVRLSFFASSFILSVVLLSYFATIIKEWILQDTKKILIISGLSLLCGTALFKKERALLYSVSAVGLFLTVFSLITRGLIVFGGETEKILPLFEKENLNLNFVLSSLAVFGVFSSASIITASNEKSISLKTWGTASLLCGIIFILIIFSCVVILGAEQTAESYDAMAIAMRESNLLGRGDILYFTVWMFLIAASLVSVAASARNMIFIKKRGMANLLITLAIFLISIFASYAKNLTTYLVYTQMLLSGGTLAHSAIMSIKKGGRNEG